MRRFLILFPAVLAVGCDDLTFPGADDSPEVSLIDLTCSGTTLGGEVHATDLNEVVLVQVDLIETDGDTGAEIQTILPESSLTEGGPITVWDVDGTLDCEASWRVDVTVTNIFGQQGAAATILGEVDADLVELDPPFGSDAGGSSIILEGPAVSLASAVRFGGEAATIVEATSEGLVVSTPAGTGTVDVEVDIVDQTVALSESFTYYPDATGQSGGFALPSLVVFDTSIITVSSPFGDVSAAPFAQFELFFHETQSWDTSWLEATPEPGACGWGEYEWDNQDLGSYMLADQATEGGYAVPQAESGTYYLLQGDIDWEAWGGTSWDVEVVEGNESFPPMVLEDLLHVAPAPENLSLDLGSWNSATWGEDLSISFDNAADYDLVLVHPWLRSSSGWLGAPDCQAELDGSGASLSWETMTEGVDPTEIIGILLLVEFSTEVDTVLPHDNSEFRSRSRIQHWSYLSY